MPLVPHYATSRDYVYADASGDMWGFVDGRWSYLIEEGGFSQWDTYEDLPEEFGPYLKMSENVQLGLESGLHVKFG